MHILPKEEGERCFQTISNYDLPSKVKKKYSLKGTDRLCKVVELSMQCCGKFL